MSNYVKESLGKALGIDRDRERELMILSGRIVNNSTTKDEIISRIGKQGLEKKELYYALFRAGYIINRKEEGVVAQIIELAGRDLFIEDINSKATIREAIRSLEKLPEDTKRQFLKILSEEKSLISLPDGRCKCDTCNIRDLCPIREYIEFIHKEIGKLEKKKKKVFRVKIE